MSFKKNSIQKYITMLLVLILMGSILLFCLKSFSKIDQRFNGDEIHYLTLAKKGIVYNALEKNSLNFIEFYKIGKARADRDTILNNQLVKKYNYPDESENPFYLRHYHPPMATYYWSFFSVNENIIINDLSLRKSNMWLGIIAIIIFVFSLCLARVFNKTTMIVTFCLLILLVSSIIFSYSFERINFHTFQFIFASLYIAFFTNWLKANTLRNSIFLGVSTAGMFVTLETALFIVFGSLISLIIIKKVKQFFKSFVYLFLSFLATMFILWPGVFKTFAPIKTWIMHFARIFLKGNDEYASVKIGKVWQSLYMDNLLLFSVLIVVSLFLLLYSRQKLTSKIYLAPYIISIIYLLTISPFILNKTYIFPALSLIIFSIIFNLNDLKNDDNVKKMSLKASYFSLVIGGLGLFISHNNFDYNEEKLLYKTKKKVLIDELSSLKEILKNKNNVLAFNGQFYKYYLNDDSIIEMRKNKATNPGYYIREKGLYKDVLPDIKNNKYEAIIIPTIYLNFYTESRTKILKDYNYHKKEFENFIIFLLNDNLTTK